MRMDTIEATNVAGVMDTTELAQEYLVLMQKIVSNAPFNQVQEYSRGEMMVLRYLELKEGEDASEPVTPGDMSQALGLTTARIANVLKSLERKGLVERVHDTEDRRRVFVTLTDAGREFTRRKTEQVVSGAEEFILHMGEEDAPELIRLLGRMVSYCEEEQPAQTSIVTMTDETGDAGPDVLEVAV